LVFRAGLMALYLFFAGTAFARGEIVVHDDLGNSVSLSGPATKVVSLYAGHSETLLAMGYGDRLVAVSQSDDGELFPGIPRLPRNFDPESIIALNPDLILSRPMLEGTHGRALDVLRRTGIPVVNLDPPVWTSLFDYVRTIGELFDDRGDVQVDLLARSIERLFIMAETRREGGKKPVFFLETGEKGIRTCSPDSWAAGILELAGGINGASDASPLREGSPLAPYGMERLIGITPTLDIYIVQQGAMNDVTEKSVSERPWIEILRGKRILFIDERDLSRPSVYRMESTVRRLADFFFSEDR